MISELFCDDLTFTDKYDNFIFINIYILG